MNAPHPNTVPYEERTPAPLSIVVGTLDDAAREHLRDEIKEDRLPSQWDVGPSDFTAAVLVGITQAIGPHHFGLVFNNHRCVHGRGAVEGRRWLKRVYGSRKCELADARDLVSVWTAVGATGIDHSF